MASITDLQAQVNYAQNLVRQGQATGVLSAAQAAEHLRALGVTEARTATITLRVSGNVAGGYGANDVNRAVEQALTNVARQAGVTIEAGSVRVDLG